MRQKYESPRITDERSLEAQALACNKVPGLGDPNFCGPVWVGLHGVSDPLCSMSDLSRSS